MKALVLFSGGVDSTTCLGMAIEKYGREQVTALSVFYGQKHKKEMEAAKQIAVYYQVEHLQLDLERIFQYSNCALLSHSDQDIPKEDCKPDRRCRGKTGFYLCAVSKWTVFSISSQYWAF